MKDLVIIGAGGLGREVLEWAREASLDWRIKGFLDDNPKALQGKAISVPILGGIAAYSPGPDDVFLCGLGTPKLRRMAWERIKAAGGSFATLVHPAARVASTARLGEGVIVGPFVYISVAATVGEGSAIYYHSTIDHDAVIGRWSQISAHCDVTGGAQVGSEVLLGSHASILPKVRVGDRAVVGAGAVVISNVEDGATVVGVPARPLAPAG